jgi:enterochelin esterase family protein
MLYEDLLEDRLIDPRDGFERPAWILPPTVEGTAATLFLDGELYIERVRAVAVVRGLREAGSIPDGPTFFLGTGGGAARHRDFACRPEYADFVAGPVVAWMRHDYPRIDRIVLAGLSLSGLAAAHAATQYPNVFPRTVCQSPSFWWERGRFADELPPAAKPAAEFWICVGNQETEKDVSHPPTGLRQELTQMEGCLAGAAALRTQGYGVTYREYDGGHDPNCWRDDLRLALPWAWNRHVSEP